MLKCQVPELVSVLVSILVSMGTYAFSGECQMRNVWFWGFGWVMVIGSL
jgi:hypothetical protein